MLKIISLVTCLAFVVVLAGCAASDTTTNSSTPTTTSSPATPVNTSTPASTTASTGDKIGVPECDDFIAKYEACVANKVPEVARAQYKASIEQWRKSWRDLAAKPQTKETLAQACKTTIEQARQSMKSFNCEF